MMLMLPNRDRDRKHGVVIMSSMDEKLKLKWYTHLHLGTHEEDEDENDEQQLLQRMDLPHDLITFQILTRLPLKSLLRFKSVSKQWYSTLSSPHFGNAHFNFSQFNHPFSFIHCVLLIQSHNHYFLFSYDDGSITKGLLELETNFDVLKDEIFLVGSCNGVVCLVSSTDYLIIWNPIIHQFAKFPCPFPPREEEGNIVISWGFGYDSSCDEYKIVRLAETGHPKEVICQIFSLRTQKWKQVHDSSLRQCSFDPAKRSVAVLVNETLYWIMDNHILGFDLVMERFYKKGCLIPGDSYLTGVSFLCVMGGYLSMCRFTNRGDVSISMMKEHGQIEYIGLYRDMDLGSCCDLFGFTMAGEFFIQLGDRELGLVDPNSSPMKYTRVVTFQEEGRSCVSSYIPSLISPLDIAHLHKK